LKNAVKNSSNLRQVIIQLGLTAFGGNYPTIKQRIKELDVPICHFKRADGLHFKPEIPLHKVLISDSSYSRQHLKKRLLKEGLLENKCSICNLKPFWNGKKLILVLDHINGNSRDHSLINLRILCPNCHSQTETFSRSHVKKVVRNCEKCGNIKKWNKSKLCRKCSCEKNRKVNRPAYEILKKEVENLGFTKTGQKYGVSDNSIRKWLKWGI
jgi:hypothetical protein